MDTSSLRNVISQLGASHAQEVLHAVLDKVDLNKDGSFNAQDLKTLITNETAAVATKALANPWRTFQVAAISGCVCFVAGGFASYFLFH